MVLRVAGPAGDEVLVRVRPQVFAAVLIATSLIARGTVLVNESGEQMHLTSGWRA